MSTLSNSIDLLVKGLVLKLVEKNIITINPNQRLCTMPILDEKTNKKVICCRAIINDNNFFCNLHLSKQEDIKSQVTLVQEKKILLPSSIGDGKKVFSIGNNKYFMVEQLSEGEITDIVKGVLINNKLQSLTDEHKKELDECEFEY